MTAPPLFFRLLAGTGSCREQRGKVMAGKAKAVIGKEADPPAGYKFDYLPPAVLVKDFTAWLPNANLTKGLTRLPSSVYK